MNQSPAAKTKTWVTLVTILVVLLISLPITFVIMVGIGYTSGAEFSPDDFSRRQFSYNQLPYLNWVFSGKTYHDTTSAFAQGLVADGLIQPIVRHQKEWHLVADSTSQFDQVPQECDARFLTDYLDLTDEEGVSYWETWNTDYPKSAKLFWPKVADLARHQMYLKMPDVMQSAMTVTADRPEAFDQMTDKLISQAYFELGTLDLQVEIFNRAKIRLDRSIEIQPSPAAYRQRAQVFEKLGQPNLAKADLASADSYSDSLPDVKSPSDRISDAASEKAEDEDIE